MPDLTSCLTVLRLISVVRDMLHACFRPSTLGGPADLMSCGMRSAGMVRPHAQVVPTTDVDDKTGSHLPPAQVVRPLAQNILAARIDHTRDTLAFSGPGPQVPCL